MAEEEQSQLYAVHGVRDQSWNFHVDAVQVPHLAHREVHGIQNHGGHPHHAFDQNGSHLNGAQHANGRYDRTACYGDDPSR